MPLVDNVDNWRRFRSAEFEFRHGQGFVPAIPILAATQPSKFDCLLETNAGVVLDNLRPLNDLVADEGVELGRRAADGK